MATPRCAHCSGTKVHWALRSLNNIEGILAYCGDCGVIFSWSPLPQAK